MILAAEEAAGERQSILGEVSEFFSDGNIPRLKSICSNLTWCLLFPSKAAGCSMCGMTARPDEQSASCVSFPVTTQSWESKPTQVVYNLPTSFWRDFDATLICLKVAENLDHPYGFFGLFSALLVQVADDVWSVVWLYGDREGMKRTSKYLLSPAGDAGMTNCPERTQSTRSPA